MDREILQHRIKKIQNVKDLVRLLNELKSEVLGEETYAISVKDIYYHCNPNKRFEDGIKRPRYYHFTIPKKSGGTRSISSPCNGLKSILTYLNILFQGVYETPTCVYGFVPGRNVTDNAKVHVNQNYVFNIDLQDFFPNFHQARVWKCLQLEPFGFNKEVATVIAGLCCMRKPEAHGEPKSLANSDYILPQGAPTSPILTNILCRRLDRKLNGLAKRFGLNYTRYADDITFSSSNNVYQEGSEFRQELSRIIESENLRINLKKTRLQKKDDRQEVTGLTVNEKVNVSRCFVRDIRQILYIWGHHGLPEAEKCFNRHYRSVKVGKELDPFIPPMPSVIEGKLLYLKMVKGETDAVYMALSSKFEKLMKSVKTRKIKHNEYRQSLVLWSMSLQEFKEKLNVDIKMTPRKLKNGTESNKFNLIIEGLDKTEMPGDSMISVSQKTIQEYVANPEKIKISRCVSVNPLNQTSFYFWMTTFRPKGNLEKVMNAKSDALTQKLEAFYNNGEFDLSKL